METYKAKWKLKTKLKASNKLKIVFPTNFVRSLMGFGIGSQNL